MTRRRNAFWETALIVVGVLLAFAIESHWSNYQESREDGAYVAALRAELQINRDRLQGRVEELSASREAILTLMDESPQASKIPSLLWQATSIVTPTAASTALESLGDSSAWARLADPELQLSLSRLAEDLERLRSMGRSSEDYWFAVVEPMLAERVDFREWERLGFHDEVAGPTFDAAAWSALVEDPVFRNRLVHLRWFCQILGARAKEVVDRIDALLEDLPANR